VPGEHNRNRHMPVTLDPPSAIPHSESSSPSGTLLSTVGSPIVVSSAPEPRLGSQPWFWDPPPALTLPTVWNHGQSCARNGCIAHCHVALWTEVTWGESAAVVILRTPGGRIVRAATPAGELTDLRGDALLDARLSTFQLCQGGPVVVAAPAAVGRVDYSSVPQFGLVAGSKHVEHPRLANHWSAWMGCAGSSSHTHW